MQLPGRCLELKGWGGDKCREWDGRKKWILLCEPSGYAESNPFWEGLTQTGMTISHSALYPPGKVAHTLPRKRGRREKSKLLLTSPPKMWDPGLIVARCCSREREGKSVLFSLKVAKGGRLSHQLQLNGKINYFSRNCGIMRRNVWILVVQSCWRTQCSWLELIKQILTELSRNPEMKIDSFKLEG